MIKYKTIFRSEGHYSSYCKITECSAQETKENNLAYEGKAQDVLMKIKILYIKGQESEWNLTC